MLQREHSAILSIFIKLPFVIKIFVLSMFEWLLKTGFTVYLIACWKILHYDPLRLLIFFRKSTFSEMLFKNTMRVSNSLGCVRPDIVSGLILVRTVCKTYKQTPLVDKESIKQFFSHIRKVRYQIKHFLGRLSPYICACWENVHDFCSLLNFEEKKKLFTAMTELKCLFFSCKFI